MNDEPIKLNLHEPIEAELAEQPLQFDRVEAEASPEGMVCTACNDPILHEYHQVDGNTVCGKCRAEAQEALKRKPGFVGFLRALLFGILGGAVGSAIYYGIFVITSGYEFSLVAIIVGLLVGGGVRKGSNGYGGWLYQLLAIVLTYGAIVSTYVPMVLTEMGKNTETRSIAEATGIAYLFVLVLVFVFAWFVPILAGFENILGWIIIAIGLWQAWKMNKRRVVAMSGPHRIAPRVEQVELTDVEAVTS